MKYECPSCFLQWQDSIKPLDLKCMPTCVFCSLDHTQKELLNWQSDHIEDLNPKKTPLFMRHLFRYFEGEINSLREEINSLREEMYEERKSKKR